MTRPFRGPWILLIFTSLSTLTAAAHADTAPDKGWTSDLLAPSSPHPSLWPRNRVPRAPWPGGMGPHGVARLFGTPSPFPGPLAFNSPLATAREHRPMSELPQEKAYTRLLDLLQRILQAHERTRVPLFGFRCRAPQILRGMRRLFFPRSMSCNQSISLF